MILEFNQASNPEERKILTTPAESISDLTLHEDLIHNIKATAIENDDKCVGIASNQIWKIPDEPPPAMFIAKLGPTQDWKIFVNPSIKGTGPKLKYKEGCMSLKGKKPKLKKRDKNVIITYFDIEDKTEKTEKYFNYDARIIQHEFDHLKGILI